ncbi:DUF2189 domain-containing protein [Terrihabitans rhizophilus]|uniref:DUF2189 domain-containing protein n=1 Tax=Terrihabitans rhizophilus TaxID=3092662 RepID=A0ABU4RLI0_9HYPH|nr:DUF2189 domain-containing protein [Terrihabitans sp. PJ23]MDX6804954.1 DUF2189 domain-containing protein [Terrihabitans sp. PJ23]
MSHAETAPHHLVTDRPDAAIRRIGIPDLRDSLRDGWNDFLKHPSHNVFLAVLYPVVGMLLGLFVAGGNAMDLLYPLISGFALVGPLAALGFYEISRREQMGERVPWTRAFDVLRGPAALAIIQIAILLTAIFVLWLICAHALFTYLLPGAEGQDLGGLLRTIFSTSEGWALIVVGNALGFIFAAVAFSVSVVSLPYIVDRKGGAAPAVATSFRAVRANPLPMAAWGLVVAALLVLGSLPFLMGLAVVVPVLGHATWHLYRRLVIAD